jgi:hypothetical protein
MFEPQLAIARASKEQALGLLARLCLEVTLFQQHNAQEYLDRVADRQFRVSNLELPFETVAQSQAIAQSDMQAEILATTNTLDGVSAVIALHLTGT